jgi:hypothetical protein
MRNAGACLTLVSWVLDHLGDHCLHDSNVSVQSTTNESRQESNPEGTCHTEDDTRHSDTGQANQRDRFPAVNIGDGSP